jgi:hypothetical protein
VNDKQLWVARELLANIKQQLGDGVDDAVGVLERTESLLVDLLSAGEEGNEPKGVKHECEDCGCLETAHIPCPYAQDLHGDETLHWLCEDCAEDRGMEL